MYLIYADIVLCRERKYDKAAFFVYRLKLGGVILVKLTLGYHYYRLNIVELCNADKLIDSRKYRRGGCRRHCYEHIVKISKRGTDERVFALTELVDDEFRALLTLLSLIGRGSGGDYDVISRKQSNITVLERASRAAYDCVTDVCGRALGRTKDADSVKSAHAEHYFSVYLFCHCFSSLFVL